MANRKALRTRYKWPPQSIQNNISDKRRGFIHLMFDNVHCKYLQNIKIAINNFKKDSKCSVQPII